MQHAINLINLEITSAETEYFYSKIAKAEPEQCWNWQGTERYGRFHITRNRKKMKIVASRVAFFLFWKVDPGEWLVCHECDNPRCCNPHHLFVGSPLDNMLDKVRKGRQAKCGPKNPNAPKGDAHWTRKTPEKIIRGEKHPARLHPERLSRGEKHYATHLLNEDILAIRELAADKTAYKEIAARFNISRATVCRIAQKKAWQHV